MVQAPECTSFSGNATDSRFETSPWRVPQSSPHFHPALRPPPTKVKMRYCTGYEPQPPDPPFFGAENICTRQLPRLWQH